MSFRIKKSEEITTKMITWYVGLQNKVTDVVVGSASRTKFEVVALELEFFYYQTFRAIKKAIPTSIYRAFGHTVLPATKATDYVTLTADIAPVGDITIPIGTLVATVKTTSEEERVYETKVEVTLLSGENTVNALVACTRSGIFGNTGAATITVMKTAISGVDSVSNAASFTTGLEKETEDQRRARFTAFVQSLSRGTDVSIETGAKTAILYDISGEIAEQVKQANLVFVTNGVLACYIYNGTGGTSAELITEAQKLINGYIDISGEKIIGYKSAGDVCIVYAATEIPQDITATVTALSGYDTTTIKTKAEEVVASYIGSLGIGSDFILSELIERIMGINGVYNIAISVPSSDVSTNVDEVVVADTVSITVN
jgi:uncharacterized phage protein gp47/JayE